MAGRIIRSATVALAAAAFVIGGASAASADNVDTTYQPVGIEFTCNGTTLLTYSSGQLHYVSTETVDPDGTVHIIPRGRR